MAVLGALFFGFFPWAFSASLHYTTAARGAIGLATLPIQTLVVAVLFGREGLTGAKMLSVSLAFAGIVVVFGSAALHILTEWHMRYGSRGGMIYWHVEKHATCIYSQLKTRSPSEVAFMLEGLLRHGTDMEVEKNDVDSGGQSGAGFAFCHLLGLHLLPRLKGSHRQKLYQPIEPLFRW